MTSRPTTTGKPPAMGAGASAAANGAGSGGGKDRREQPTKAGPEVSAADTSELTPVPADRDTRPARPTTARAPGPATSPPASGPRPAAATPAAGAGPGTGSAVTARAPQPSTPVAPGRTGSGAAPTRPVATRQGPRRARLMVTRLDPWSVMKTFFMLSLAVAIVLVVAVALLWWTLDVTGVFAAVNRTVDDVVGSGSTPFDFMAVAGFERVMGATLVLAAVEIVLVSAMATLFAFLYNLTVGFTHGLEITLTEDS